MFHILTILKYLVSHIQNQWPWPWRPNAFEEKTATFIMPWDSPLGQLQARERKPAQSHQVWLCFTRRRHTSTQTLTWCLSPIQRGDEHMFSLLWTTFVKRRNEKKSLKQSFQGVFKEAYWIHFSLDVLLHALILKRHLVSTSSLRRMLPGAGSNRKKNQLHLFSV